MKSTRSAEFEALLERIPGEIVLYEWNGQYLKTLCVSRSYAKKYGTIDGAPNCRKIHPDDFEEYRIVIADALKNNHDLEHIFRARIKEEEEYRWIRIKAVGERCMDGKIIVYAVYSDVTEEKHMEIRLQESRKSLESALKVSKQSCYVYDTGTHTSECITEVNLFNLPRIITDYPDSMVKMNLIHPKDIESFIHAVHKIDNGSSASHCDIRFKINNEYRWYSCRFNAYYDKLKHRTVAIVSIYDISLRMLALNIYEKHFQSLISYNKDAIYMGFVNLTQNTFKEIEVGDEREDSFLNIAKYDELIITASKRIADEKQRENFLISFERKSLLNSVKKGNVHIKMDHLYYISSDIIEWAQTTIEFMKNPLTGDIVGLGYTKNIHHAKLETLLLKKNLLQDYPKVAIIAPNRSDYYFFDEERDIHCKYCKDFWNKLSSDMKSITTETNLDILEKRVTKEGVLSELKNGKEYVFAFDGVLNKKNQRFEMRFSYFDEAHRFILASLKNITDDVLLEKLRYESTHDSLTGLYNRNAVFQRCEELLKEYPNEKFVMVHFDIKHFRLYNTFYGDKAGDQLLCYLSDMFKEIGRKVSRWAYGRIEADVFCLFFVDDKKKYEEYQNQFLVKLKHFRQEVLIEAAIGVYYVEDRSMSIEAMFTRASVAAKEGKENVSKKITYYNKSMEMAMLYEQQIKNEMQAAIEKEQFQVYFQPKYSLLTHQLIGAEALVRWEHPQKGLISPNHFIPIFEKNGFIAVLDRYMWEHVCILIKKWKENKRQELPVSVNVSRVSMFNLTTVEFLKSLVDKYHIDPAYLELELTESAYMDDPCEMKLHLLELQRYGFRILMDDFGSGYSSLNTLRELPVDCIKLDMHFLEESTKNNRGRLILSSVVHLTKLLSLPVIAEGVENIEQAEFLTSIGCEMAQGYLFAMPMPQNEYEELLVNPTG